MGVLLIAGAITGVFLLKNPSAGPRLAQADEGAVTAATARISAALGVGTDGITQANEAYFPGADVSLKWKGGLAEIDGATGLIFLVSQDGQPGDPSARTLDASELDTAADLAVALQVRGLRWTGLSCGRNGLHGCHERPGAATAD